MMLWGGPRTLGIALLIMAMIPAGDMSLILIARGSIKAALGIHDLKAALRIAGPFPYQSEQPETTYETSICELRGAPPT